MVSLQVLLQSQQVLIAMGPMASIIVGAIGGVIVVFSIIFFER
jgi:hypothetical protein